jgi:hypothetical protein
MSYNTSYRVTYTINIRGQPPSTRRVQVGVNSPFLIENIINYFEIVQDKDKPTSQVRFNLSIVTNVHHNPDSYYIKPKHPKHLKHPKQRHDSVHIDPNARTIVPFDVYSQLGSKVGSLCVDILDLAKDMLIKTDMYYYKMIKGDFEYRFVTYNGDRIHFAFEDPFTISCDETSQCRGTLYIQRSRVRRPRRGRINPPSTNHPSITIVPQQPTITTLEIKTTDSMTIKTIQLQTYSDTVYTITEPFYIVDSHEKVAEKKGIALGLPPHGVEGDSGDGYSFALRSIKRSGEDKPYYGISSDNGQNGLYSLYSGFNPLETVGPLQTNRYQVKYRRGFSMAMTTYRDIVLTQDNHQPGGGHIHREWQEPYVAAWRRFRRTLKN